MCGIFATRAASGPRAGARSCIRLELPGHLLELVRELHQRFSGIQIGTLGREPEAIPGALMEHVRIHLVAPWYLR
jgi:hypothetical protein